MNTSKAAAALVSKRRRGLTTCEQCATPFLSRLIGKDEWQVPEARFCSVSCSRTHRNNARKVASNLNRLAS